MSGLHCVDYMVVLTQVSRSDLRDLLLQCCADEAPDVRQSALALLGDLVKVLYNTINRSLWYLHLEYYNALNSPHQLLVFPYMNMVCDPEQACAVHLQPRLAEFLNLAAKQLVGIFSIEVS